jgi:hypothetical protein
MTAGGKLCLPAACIFTTKVLAALQQKHYCTRMKLTLADERAEAPVETPPVNPTMIVLEAIVRRRCISVTYNRKRMILAPHILYSRREQLYVDAFTVSLEGMLPREVKLGTFKLDGLNDLKLIEREFVYNPMFEPEAEKYAGVTLMVAEPETAEAA